jgi:hypothetical protein
VSKRVWPLLLVVLPLALQGAEFERRIPAKILELNEKTLLQNVWPGMTIVQAIQILGEPEERLQLVASTRKGSAPAIRYGIYWLIPQPNGIHVRCIIHQRGLMTEGEKVHACFWVDEKYRLAYQLGD